MFGKFWHYWQKLLSLTHILHSIELSINAFFIGNIKIVTIKMYAICLKSKMECGGDCYMNFFIIIERNNYKNHIFKN